MSFGFESDKDPGRICLLNVCLEVLKIDIVERKRGGTRKGENISRDW